MEISDFDALRCGDLQYWFGSDMEIRISIAFDVGVCNVGLVSIWRSGVLITFDVEIFKVGFVSILRSGI